MILSHLQKKSAPSGTDVEEKRVLWFFKAFFERQGFGCEPKVRGQRIYMLVNSDSSHLRYKFNLTRK